MQNDDDLITTTEALELLGKGSASTVSRWVSTGRLTPVRKMPGLRGAFLFRRSDVLAARDDEAVTS